MSELLLDVKLGIPVVSTPAGVADQWQEGFKNNAQRINEKRTARVGTPESFSSVLAGPAAQGYGPYLNPSFTSRKGRSGAQSTNDHRINLERSFLKYKSKLDYWFAVDPISGQSPFQDMIDFTKDSFSEGNAERTLRITGTKEAGLGIAGIASLLLTGDKQALAYLRGCDKLSAGTELMFPALLNSRAFKSMLPGVLSYTGVEWIKNNFSPEVADSLNSQLADLLTAMVDVGVIEPPVETYTPGSSFVGWQQDSELGPILRVVIYSGTPVTCTAMCREIYDPDTHEEPFFSESYRQTAIVNTEIDANAAIADTKLATIATAGKVSGAAFTLLPNIPAGAGVIPAANLPAACSGDVLGPATNTADYVPQWNGANSKTLKDGKPIGGASGIASLDASSKLVQSPANGAITLSMQANLAANSIQGNNTGSAATPIALTVAQVNALLNVLVNLEGGSASSVYLANQIYDGGGA
jgi:hypothetical protein